MNRSSYPLSKRSAKARPVSRWNYREEDDDDEEDEVELPESSDEEGEDEDFAGYQRAVESNYRNRSSKKRKVDEGVNSSYEFRPRGIHTASHPQWDDHSTYVLLDTWGERFLQLGRSSLRSDDWGEVAERVSEVTGSEFGVSDCRSRLNLLKNKYRKEKAKLEAVGGGSSKWIYFKKMDMLMTMPPRQQQQCGLACGVDSGEFVFMNPRVFLDCSNAHDEMRDSPDNSEEEDDEDRRGRRGDGGDETDDLESYRILSESIKRIGEIYENIESSKRHHMMELERMRMNFQRDLEMQKKEMFERTRAEIERIQQAEDEDEDEGVEDGDGDGDGSAQTASE